MKPLFLSLFLLFGITACPVYAQSANKSMPHAAHWSIDSKDQTRHLEISLEAFLNEKHEELINSGFSTFSQLVLYTQTPKKKVVHLELTCTVKYDLWEEIYDLAWLDQTKPQVLTAKTFAQYAKLCLRGQLDQETVNQILKSKESLIAELHLEQISADKASEIKEWLVRQQSGVMRGIFSHMLGDLKLSESIKVTIAIPK